MVIRLYIILILVLFINESIFSQNSFTVENYDRINPLMQLSDIKQPKFEDVRKIYEQHWNNADRKTPAGWKQFKRWEYFWETRLMPDGSFPDGYEIYDEILKYEAKYNRKNPQTQSNQWELLGPINLPAKYNDARTQGLGRINVIRFDPQNTHTLWAGSATGGVWKSTDLGKTWQGFPFTNFLSSGVSDIAIYPKNSNVIYVATGDDDGTYGTAGAYYSVGLIRTFYAGMVWEKTNLSKELSDKYVISRVLVHPDDFNTVIVGTSTGIFKSTDGGKTWVNSLSGVYIKDMEFKVDNPTILNAVSYSYSGIASFYHSTDTGDSWTTTHTLSGASRIAITVSPSNPNKVWAVASRAGYTSFHSYLISSDAGANWELYNDYTVSPNILGRYSGTKDDSLEGQGNYDLCIAVNPNNEDEVYVGGINVWKSTDSGNSFDRITNWTGGGNLPFLHADIHDLQFKPNSSNLYSGHDGGLGVTTDLGKTWSEITNGMSVTQYYRIGMSKTNQNLIIGGTQDNGTNMLSDNGWVHLRAGDGMEAFIHPTNDNIMFMSYYYGSIHKSQDKGKTWNTSIEATNVGESGAWVTPYVISPSNPEIMYVGFQNIYKSRSTGSAGSWTKVSNFGSQTFRSLAISPTNPNYVYAATQYEIFATTDGGGNWNSIYKASNIITYIVVDPNNHSRIWVTIGGFSAGIKVIEINGSEIINVSGNLPNVPVNCIIYQNNSPDRLYIGTDIGVYVSDYNSSYWESYGENMPKVIINELEIFEPDNKLIAATYGRGVWKTDLLTCNLDQPSISVLGATEFCEGDSVRIEAEEGFTNYLWSNGSRERVIYAKESGAYSVRIFDEFGCYANSKAVFVTVKDVPDLNIVNSSNLGFCNGGSIKISASLGFTSYLWSTGDKGRTITVSQAGDYWVTGTANNGCTKTSDIVQIIEFPIPSKPIIEKSGNTLKALSDNVQIESCEWYFNGEKLEGADKDVYLANKDGKYSVIAIDSNGCKSEISLEYDIVLSIEEANIEDGIIVYPNPGDGAFNLYIKSNYNRIASIEVNDILGKTILQIPDENLQIGENLFKININDQATGIYFIKIQILDNIKFVKIVKK